MEFSRESNGHFSNSTLIYHIYINWALRVMGHNGPPNLPEKPVLPSFVLYKVFLRRPTVGHYRTADSIGWPFSIYGLSDATFVFGSTCQPVPSSSTDVVFTLRLCWIKVSSHYPKMIEKVLMSSEQEDLDRKPFYSRQFLWNVLWCDLKVFTCPQSSRFYGVPWGVWKEFQPYAFRPKRPIVLVAVIWPHILNSFRYRNVYYTVQ